MSENLQWAVVFVLMLLKEVFTVAILAGLAWSLYWYFNMLFGHLL